MRPLTRILAPVDLQCVSWEPLDYAGWLAAPSGAIVDLLYVHPVDAHDGQAFEQARCNRFTTILATLIARFAGDEFDDESTAQATRQPIFIGNMHPGSPVDSILDFASRGDHDVIVVGARQRVERALPLRGSIAEQLTRRAPCPVLTVPSLPVDDRYPAHPRA